MRKRLLTVALLLLCVLLGLAAAGSIEYARDWRAARLVELNQEELRTTQDATGGDRAPALSLDFPPMDFFADMVERPLFSDTRRPPPPEALPPEAPPPEAPPPQPLRATLTSVIITSEARVALVNDQVSGKAVRLQPGTSLQGWQVETIESDRVTFSQGGETQTLELRDYGKSQTEPPSPPPNRSLRRSRETPQS